jgi:hypothetical protein
MLFGRKRSGPELKEEIADATAEILRSENVEEVKDPLARIRKAFKEANGKCLLSTLEPSYNPEGNAISPPLAADCIDDCERTRQFLRGLREAIRTAQERFHGEVIQVLYAGCGPYGTLAVPLMCGEFEPDDVKFTLVDIHRVSIKSVRAIIEKLGVEKHIQNLIRDNAITYKHEGIPPHVAVTETMLPALMFEPQAAVSSNIASQLREGGILVPEKITLRVYAREAPRLFFQFSIGETFELGTLFELTKDTPCISSPTTGRKNVLIEKAFRLPDFKRAFELFIGTRVQVFGDTVLPEEAAQITRERFIQHVPRNRSGGLVRVSYLGGATEVNVEYLPDEA